MQASVSVLLGILIATVIIVITRCSKPEGSALSAKKSTIGWLCFALGLIALAAFLIQTLPVFYYTNIGLPFSLISILLATISVTIGIWSVLKHDRHWPVWVGLIAGAIPALFWIAFVLGYILGLGNEALIPIKRLSLDYPGGSLFPILLPFIIHFQRSGWLQ